MNQSSLMVKNAARHSAPGLSWQVMTIRRTTLFTLFANTHPTKWNWMAEFYIGVSTFTTIDGLKIHLLQRAHQSLSGLQYIFLGSVLCSPIAEAVSRVSLRVPHASSSRRWIYSRRVQVCCDAQIDSACLVRVTGGLYASRWCARQLVANTYLGPSKQR